MKITNQIYRHLSRRDFNSIFPAILPISKCHFSFTNCALKHALRNPFMLKITGKCWTIVCVKSFVSVRFGNYLLFVCIVNLALLWNTHLFLACRDFVSTNHFEQWRAFNGFEWNILVRSVIATKENRLPEKCRSTTADKVKTTNLNSNPNNTNIPTSAVYNENGF